MINANSPNYSAHPPTTAEVDGEIMPSYAANTPNAPSYRPESARDIEIPHDIYEEANATPMPRDLQDLKERLGGGNSTKRDERHITLGYIAGRGGL